MIDDTLLKVGIKTNYHKIYKKSLWLVLGWLIIVIFMNYGMALWMNTELNYNILAAMCIFLMRNYFTYINILNDLIIGSILGYIRLKFDQVNRYLLNLSKDNKFQIEWASENQVLLSHQHRFLKSPSNERMIWILIHLYLELRKISYDINSIFGTQMTFKMGCYFFWLALDLREIFSLILTNNFVKDNIRVLYTITILLWILLDVSKLFLINYMCETVSAKANATGNLINRMQYFTYNIEIRENISQLLLQMTQMPVRFYGIGLFQFGYKFLQGFSSSITTVLVLLIQKHINKQTSIKNE
ncbi:uncharacterized protein [Anoplolepis gracilipes]|uniref:uncharacterized protein n=1 Tax=Anoplolepis gracilipes TaxID=354296 RepID=UPI003B9F76E7